MSHQLLIYDYINSYNKYTCAKLNVIIIISVIDDVDNKSIKKLKYQRL